MSANNQTPTISLQDRLCDLLKIATQRKASFQVARIDMGQGNEVAVVAIVNDSEGFIDTIQNYDLCQKRYATKIANAVAVSIAKNGLPDPDHPEEFNLILSDDGADRDGD